MTKGKFFVRWWSKTLHKYITKDNLTLNNARIISAKKANEGKNVRIFPHKG